MAGFTLAEDLAYSSRAARLGVSFGVSWLWILALAACPCEAGTGVMHSIAGVMRDAAQFCAALQNLQKRGFEGRESPDPFASAVEYSR